MEKLCVRVYNVRFGDAILVSVPDRSPSGDTQIRHILIDVGNVLRGEGGHNPVFEPVFRNIEETLAGQPVDLYVMTHEHMDHVQGLLWANKVLGKRLEVDYAWMTASANPDYYQTHPQARERKRLADESFAQIQAYLAASPDSAIPYQAMMLNNNPNSTRDCVAYLRELASRKTSFVHREFPLEDSHPFQEAKLKIWGPEEDTSSYYGSFKPMALGLDGGLSAGEDSSLLRLVPPPGVDAGAFYNLVESRRRSFADNLLAIDQAANNTSVVFSLEWRGWKLLFTGDAEIRSWRTMDARQALEEVDFLKVSHHGSDNGTPMDLLDKILPQRETGRMRYIAASTYPDTYSGIPGVNVERVLGDRGEWHTTQEVRDGGYLDFEFFEDGTSRVTPVSPPEAILLGAAQPAAEEGALAAAPAPADAAERTSSEAGSLGLRGIDEKLHILNLSKDGTFLESPLMPSGQFSSRPEDVDAMFTQMASENTSHLVLYFHGGMVPEKAGLAGARNLLPHYRVPGQLYPIFFVWETGWYETILNNLESIRLDGIFERVLKIVLKFVQDKLADRAATAGLGLAAADPPVEPPTRQEEQALMAELVDDPQLQVAVDDLVNDLQFERLGGGLSLDNTAAGAEEPPQRTLLKGAVQEELLAEASRPQVGFVEFSPAVVVFARGAVRVFRRVVTRFQDRTDHGAYGTIAEEILRELYMDDLVGWLWGEMKEEARQSFEDNTGLSGMRMHGGTYFLEKLREYQANHPELRVSLVGHSAGSIYISRLVEKAAQIMPPEFQFDWIVFLAPGVDFELFRRAIVDHSERFRNFRMYSMQDELEVQDVMVPVIYPQSILYFVSGLLEGDREKPIVGLHRFFQSGSPYNDDTVQAVRRFMLDPAAKRVVWTIQEAGEVGFLSAARKHGGFGHEPLTLRSVLHILSSSIVPEGNPTS